MLCLTHAIYARPVVIVIHGGAGTIDKKHMTNKLKKKYINALNTAVSAGYKILKEGGHAKDAVIAAIKIMEDSPLFNAGIGAAYSSDGGHVLEASLMDGFQEKGGSVVGLKHIQHPIELANCVLDESKLVMMYGSSAEEYALQKNIKLVSNHSFDTTHRYKSYLKWKNIASSDSGVKDDEQKYGTVGAVALDKYGHLAAGTSTGGLTGKNPGRIGDSPIIGAGTFANQSCAVSTTGRGEDFIIYHLAGAICDRQQYLKKDIDNVAESLFKEFTEKRGKGGVIGVGRNGKVVMLFNTRGMYRALKSSSGITKIAIY